MCKLAICAIRKRKAGSFKVQRSLHGLGDGLQHAMRQVRFAHARLIMLCIAIVLIVSVLKTSVIGFHGRAEPNIPK